jgi:hypothetical protein
MLLNTKSTTLREYKIRKDQKLEMKCSHAPVSLLNASNFLRAYKNHENKKNEPPKKKTINALQNIFTKTSFVNTEKLQ